MILINTPHIELFEGDCIELMKDIPDKSIDLILCDLPYGTTDYLWDKVLPLDLLWIQYKRIINNGAIVLFSQPPFNADLAMSNRQWYKYEWIWIKEHITNFLFAKSHPLKITENVLVFYENLPVYNPQMLQGFEPYIKRYRIGKKIGNAGMTLTNKIDRVVINDGERYPINILEFKRDNMGCGTTSLHPTQKPIALCEYLIKTYTNKGMTILDNTAGSGTTGIAAYNTNRNCILIEKDPIYCDIIKQRVYETEPFLIR